MSDRSYDLLRDRVDIGNTDIQGFTNEEDVRKICNEVLAKIRSVRMVPAFEDSAPRFGLRHKGSHPPKEVHNTPLVQELRDNCRHDLTASDIRKVVRDFESRLYQTFLERKDDAPSCRFERKDAASNGSANLEAFLGVFQTNVRVVQRPDNTVDVAMDIDEKSFVGKTMYCTLFGSQPRLESNKRELTFMTCPTCSSSTFMKT